MNEETRQQKWVREHPLLWSAMCKILDFQWFFIKFLLCCIILRLISR